MSQYEPAPEDHSKTLCRDKEIKVPGGSGGGESHKKKIILIIWILCYH